MRGSRSRIEFDGKPLLASCRRRTALPIRAARVRLFDQVCAAVSHAHAHLVVHRDLKPSNVLVNADGTVKLLNFGIALVLDADEEEAPTRVFAPQYAAPEQLRGERATTATDVYALGLLLYELIAGTRLPTMERGAGADWSTRPTWHAELPRNTARRRPRRMRPRRRARCAAISAQSSRTHWRLIRAVTVRSGRTNAQRSAALARLPSTRAVRQARRRLCRRPLHPPQSRGRGRRRRGATRPDRRTWRGAMAGTPGHAHGSPERTRRVVPGRSFHRCRPVHWKHTDDKSKIELLRDAARRIDKDLPDAPQQQIKLRQIIADALMRVGEPGARQRAAAPKRRPGFRVLHGERAPQVGAALHRQTRDQRPNWPATSKARPHCSRRPTPC